jgi:hypothetical protein
VLPDQGSAARRIRGLDHGMNFLVHITPRVAKVSRPS